MQIKLCYKTYPIKLSVGANKAFTDSTGLDIQTVLQDYIAACSDSDGKSVMGKCVHLSKLYSRKIACKALHSLIDGACDGVPIEEIDDATFRVSWTLNNKPDDLSDPWPYVMLQAALTINEYQNKNLPEKKSDTSAA